MIKKLHLYIVTAVAMMTISCEKMEPTEQNISGTYNSHAYVDLGLPSGTLWATCNIDAAHPEQYGGHFAWGETVTKPANNWGTYKWGKDYNKLTKYCPNKEFGKKDSMIVNGLKVYEIYSDSLIALETSDDVAFTRWGGNWRVPTDEQWTELREQCKWESTSQWLITTERNEKGEDVEKGTEVEGFKVTSKVNNNSIFLPAAGCRAESHYGRNLYGYYWSSTLSLEYPNCAWCVNFNINGDNAKRRTQDRCDGLTIRPVFRK